MPRPEPSPSSSTVLRAAAAAAWFGDPRPAPGDALVVVFDEMRAGAFRIVRVWHTAVRSTATVTAGGVAVILPLEGETRIVPHDGRVGHRGRPGECIVLDERCSYDVVSTAPVARYEVHLPAALLPELATTARGSILLHLDSSSEAMRSVLVALLTALLNLTGSLDTESPSFSSVTSAVANLVSGLFASSEGVDGRRSNQRRNQLYSQARALISTMSADPAFSVAVLARELHISPSSLHNVFQERGTTPGAVIKETRLAALQERLRGRDATPRVVQRLGSAVGFRSAQALRRALRAAEHAGRTTGQRTAEPIVRGVVDARAHLAPDSVGGAALRELSGAVGSVHRGDRA